MFVLELQNYFITETESNFIIFNGDWSRHSFLGCDWIMPIMTSIADGDDVGGVQGLHEQGGRDRGVGGSLHTPPDPMVLPGPAGETLGGHGHVPSQEEGGVSHLVGHNDQSLVSAPVNKEGSPGGIKAVTVHRPYLLNDIGALRKKLAQESNKEPFSHGKEAKDGSNFSIQMRASVFEMVKEGFIKDIHKNGQIKKVRDGIAATVNIANGNMATKNVGHGSRIAIVEYSMDITFGPLCAQPEQVHTVKMTAYATTSTIMLQPKGEKPGKIDHLGNRCTPRYFAETFLLPWCDKKVKSEEFDASKYTEALRNQIKKLENENSKRKTAKRTSSLLMDGMNLLQINPSSLGATALRLRGATSLRKQALGNSSKTTGNSSKCVSKNCQYRGKVNVNNKAAVGKCGKCGEHEHFVCVNIGAEEKEEILKGTTKYFCSECFSDNPSLIASEALKAIEFEGPCQTQESLESSGHEDFTFDDSYRDDSYDGLALVEDHDNDTELDDSDVEIAEEQPSEKNREGRLVVEDSNESSITRNPGDSGIVQLVTKAIIHANPDNQGTTNNWICSKEGCGYKCDLKETLDSHTSLQHSQETRAVTFVGTSEDNDEVFEAADTLQCMFCPFKNMIQSTMEDHIIDLHIEKEDDNLYHCQDDCQFTCLEKNELALHFKTMHKEEPRNEADSGEPSGNNRDGRPVVLDSNESSVESTTTRNPADTDNAEEIKIKAEMKVLKRSFDRLEAMYHQALEEVNQVKSEYEAKLIVANDNFRDVKQENEILKERVDILFKLGKSYLEKDKTNGNPDIIEVVEGDNTDPTKGELPKNRMRGYKRVNPTTKPNSINLGQEAKLGKKQDETPNEDKQQKDKPNFCHFYVNFGKCNFESRTGKKCKFEHREAPPCNYGPGCTRHKCQYSHLKAKPSFLERQGAPPAPWLNPWQNRNNHGTTRNQQIIPPVSPWHVNPWMNQWNPQYHSEWPPLERHQGVRR